MFVNLSAFLTERSQLANSIFGKETFPEKNSKPYCESACAVSETSVSKHLVVLVKSHFL